MHPSAKIKLAGLLKQILCGDCTDEKKDSDALRNLAKAAWRAHKGKEKEEAMEEYLQELQEAAPNWKVARFLMGREHDSEDDGLSRRQKTRKLMKWAIKLTFESIGGSGSFRAGSFVDRTSSNNSSRGPRFRLQGLRIMQGNVSVESLFDGGDAKDMGEEGGSGKQEEEAEAGLSEATARHLTACGLSADDPYFQSLQFPIERESFFFDRSKISLQHQDEQMYSHLLALSLEGTGAGWEVVHKFVTTGTEVFAKTIDGFPARHLKSTATVQGATPRDIMEFEATRASAIWQSLQMGQMPTVESSMEKQVNAGLSL